MEHEFRHQCLVYEGSPSEQLPTLAAMIEKKLEEGQRCLYLNSRPMVAGMRSCLAARGMDVASEVAKARLVLSSDRGTAGDGSFDGEVMLHKLEDALDQALNDGYKGLWATGDMAWEFGSKQNFEKLMEYEWGLEEVFRRRPELCGICQYHRDTLPSAATRQGLLTHRMIFINATLERVNPYYVGEGGAEVRATNDELDGAIRALCQLQRVGSSGR